MKLIIRNSILFFFLFLSIILVVLKGEKINAFVSEVFDKNEGVITIVSIDAQQGFPIKDVTFQLLDSETEEVLAELTTGSDGVVRTNDLPQNKTYQIIQTDIYWPYQLNTDPQTIALLSEEEEIAIENNVHPSVTTYERTDQDEVVVTEMNLSVDTVLQEPELPNGCEVTSLASVLHYYGYEVDKTVLSDKYLPKIPFEVKNGKLYGADPYNAYAGEPRSRNQGFFSYAPPIIETVNRYFKEVGGHHKTEDITGSSPEELLNNYVQEGIPVVVWTTIDLKEPLFNYSWYVHGTEKSIDVIRNSHTVVLTGFSEEEVFVMDPLKGNVSYPMDQFFEIYKKAGSHAMVVR
ncbi:C39 family peptidase [Ornithinibacillus sp. BX22]|uniref:C39 family peptidase n=2 Tax=Ornithinibacillus TaxID=484508 RepID=A0A923L724_9BACI|nr:C39 family peptidase [Ornithinibacillus hominis]MBS3681598.1 C39 family peptidase [Ornithinibacillus massiliensis]